MAEKSNISSPDTKSNYLLMKLGLDTIHNMLLRLDVIHDPAIKYSSFIQTLLMGMDIGTSAIEYNMPNSPPDIVNKFNNITKKSHELFNGLMEYIQKLKNNSGDVVNNRETKNIIEESSKEK